MPQHEDDIVELKSAPSSIWELDTPIPLLDVDVANRNLARWQTRCDELGIANRPHIKTHKMVRWAREQLRLGAAGITVQKLGEAEVMAQAGISDLFVTFNLFGSHKQRRLAALARRNSIRVVADNPECCQQVNAAADHAGRNINVLVECDTGGKRNGVQSPLEALELARFIDRQPALEFAGLMTFPLPGQRLQSAEFFGSTKFLLEESGLPCHTVSTGGTPDMWSDEGLDIVTEYRAGTYIFNDRSLVDGGHCSAGDCAVTILATVVSKPSSGDRLTLDAGSKSLTSDLRNLRGFGIELESGRQVYALSEEHGLLDIRDWPSAPEIGDMVRLLPNHVCPVINLFDEVALVQGERVLGLARVDARGKVQ